MKPFTLVVNPVSRIFCSIKFDGKNLSICGVDRPMSNGNARGGCGQIHPVKGGPNEGWSYDMLEEFNAIWDRWHLNDMNAGTPEQEAFVRTKKKEYKYEYTAFCQLLKDAGIYTVEWEGEPYNYGSKWIFEAVPEHVIEFLSTLPKTKVKPAWV